MGEYIAMKTTYKIHFSGLLLNEIKPLGYDLNIPDDLHRHRVIMTLTEKEFEKFQVEALILNFLLTYTGVNAPNHINPYYAKIVCVINLTRRS